MGAGGALMIGGIALWIAGLEDRSKLYDTCAKACTKAQIANARDKLIAGDVVFGVGAIVAGTGIRLGDFLGARRRDHEARSPPDPMPGGGALHVSLVVLRTRRGMRVTAPRPGPY